MARTSHAVAVSTLAAYGVLQILGRRTGSTASERSASLPGDDLVHRPQLRTDHGLAVDAPAAQVWPWLTQMGWHLGGYYTPGWAQRGARFTWTWCFAITDLSQGRSRVHLRVRGRCAPWWLTAVYVGVLIPADYVMATGMLRGIGRRATSGNPTTRLGTRAVPQGVPDPSATSVRDELVG